MESKKLYNLWIAALGIVLLAGFITIIMLFVKGHGELFSTIDKIPWTILVAAYIFFILTSVGLTFITSLYTVFGYKKYQPIVKRAQFISIVSLITGLSIMVLELGKPLHMIYYVISPNPKSPIFWMGIFYSLYLAFLIVRFWKIHNGDWDSKLSRFAGVGAFFVAIAAESTAGSIFGLIEARPTFFGQFMPIYFLLDAFLSGIVTILFISLIYHKVTNTSTPVLESIYDDLSKIFAFVLGVTILFVLWRTISGLYANRPEFAVVEHMIDSWSFRAELFIGLLLPFGLMVTKAIRKNMNAKLIAAIFAWIGLGIGRMEMLMSGQILPVMPKVSIQKNMILYNPTIWEWVICFFSLALLLFLYTMGEKYLKLGASPKLATE